VIDEEIAASIRKAVDEFNAAMEEATKAGIYVAFHQEHWTKCYGMDTWHSNAPLHLDRISKLSRL